jgi:signal transduction protein with GAF and PtsI domain
LPPSESEILQKYLDAMQAQGLAQREMATDVMIEAKLPKLKRQARLHALRSVAPTGEVSYKTLDTGGDDMVRREVIARYLSADRENHQTEGLAITPSHDRFHLAATVPRRANGF